MVKKDIKQSLSASLTLPKILAKTLGFEDTIEILTTLKENNLEEYEFNEDVSNFMKFIQNHFSKSSIQHPFNILDEQKLANYDLNIKEHIEHITSKRNITIKSYQYLALLLTEIYLDHYFNCKQNNDIDGFLNFLNNSLTRIKKYTEIEEYSKEDLDKLCFWMATGSGKTLIMHINYLQYLHYADKYHQPLHNIILITPNGDLSKQHHKELKKSNIKSMIITKKNYLSKTEHIKIIDINKIRERSGPETISYKAFGKNNLILVDEGHRGTSGNTWMKYRYDIAKEGFTLEYSATFQDAKTGNDYISDYKKTIIFDYSYKYYHKDGYGKHYEISNTNQKDNDEYYENLIMLANLLSFYEQKKLFVTYRQPLETEYLIEDPLWILVGSKVVDKEKLSKAIESDISKFIRFLNELKIKRNYFIEEIQKIMEDRTPLKYRDTNESFFKNKYPYIRYLLQNEFKNQYELLLKDIFKTVLYTSNNDARLVLEDIKGSDGEIGLRYQDNPNHYFGLIYVGKGNDKKIIKNAKEKNIITTEQTIKESLFQTLNKTVEKPLNVLIGAKKFIEGWDNYRISSMLLMYFAKTKGVSAIQLFGRGVRLHGYQNSMKRSSAINPPISNKILKEYLHLLETLHVFGIQAKYMDVFREELEEDVEFYIEKEIIIRKDPYNLLKYELKCIKEDEDTVKSFKDTQFIDIKQPVGVITIDLNKHVQAISSIHKEKEKTYDTISQDKIINQTFFNIVNWDTILSEIRRFKRNKEYRNISIPTIDELKNMLLNDLEIHIKGDEQLITTQFTSYEQYQHIKQTLERVYLEIFKKHIKSIYSKNFRTYYEKNLRVTTLNKEKDLIDRYKIKIYLDKNNNIQGDKNTKEFLQILQNEAANLIDLYSLNDKFKEHFIDKSQFMIEFDKHLYIPLLISSPKGEYSLTPKGLNMGEKRFVETVKNYLKTNPLPGKQIVLLRNHENTGFGYFLETEKYYPDFILWIIDKNRQKIIFIDPKGLIHPDLEKINFHATVKQIEATIRKKYPEENIEIYSYIVTETKKTEIPESKIRQDPESYGIYFFDDARYFENILQATGIQFR